MRHLLLTFLFFLVALQGQAAKAHPAPVKVVLTRTSRQGSSCTCEGCAIRRYNTYRGGTRR